MMPLIVLFEFTRSTALGARKLTILARHYYEFRDRVTPVCTTDPLITFHLSGSVNAIYAGQASLTLLATDELAIDRS